MPRIKLKERITRLMLAALILQIATRPAQAVLGPIAIPTGDVDLSILAPVSADITAAGLTKWRNGVANTPPTPVVPPKLTFAYITGSNLALPTRAVCGDNSCNDQGDLWSDNAIQLDFKKPNSIGSAILIYTNNVSVPGDPLGNASLRGGLVGGNGGPADQTNPARASVIPLIWKAMSAADLAAVSTATLHTNPIPASSPAFMYTELNQLGSGTLPNNGLCPSEGLNTVPPLVALPKRITSGFCDFSTHYFLDQNNTDPNNLWYTKYASNTAKHNGSFDYASVVGPFGVNTTEQGAGAGQFNPAYLLLGTNLTNAIQTHYGTTINVEVLIR